MIQQHLGLIVGLYIRNDIAELETDSAIKSNFLILHSGNLRPSKIGMVCMERLMLYMRR